MADQVNVFPVCSAHVYYVSGVNFPGSIGEFKGSVSLGLHPRYNYSLRNGTNQLTFDGNDLE